MKVPELWVFRGKKPVEWTVPFYVVRRDDSDVMLVNAVPLSGRQHAAVTEYLSDLGKGDGTGRWQLHPSLLAQVAQQLDNATPPETVVFWGDEGAPPKVVPKEAISTGDPEMDEFLQDMCERGMGPMPVLVQWWLAFCQQAQHWLINKEKPVSMRFIKLHASPYRRNWMFVVLSRFPRFWRSITFLNKSARNMELEKSGFVDELLCLDLLAMHKRTGLIYRYVEVEHTKQWYKEIRRVETERFRILGWIGYARHTMASVRRRLATSIRLYAGWLADLACPSAQDVECNALGEFRIAPHIPPSPVSAHGLRTYFVPSVVPTKYPSCGIPSHAARDLYQTTEPLPDELSVIQSRERDVRNGRTILPKAGEAPDPTLRVLVPYASKGDVGAEHMLAKLNRERDRRLANGIRR